MTEDDIDDVFAMTDWLDGIPDVWRDIAVGGAQRRDHALAAVLRRSAAPLGRRSAHGAEVYAGVVPDPNLVLTPDSKVGLAQDLMTRYGVDAVDIVAYGDSSSDVPLFRDLAHGGGERHRQPARGRGGQLRGPGSARGLPRRPFPAVRVAVGQVGAPR